MHSNGRSEFSWKWPSRVHIQIEERYWKVSICEQGCQTFGVE